MTLSLKFKGISFVFFSSNFKLSVWAHLSLIHFIYLQVDFFAHLTEWGVFPCEQQSWYTSFYPHTQSCPLLSKNVACVRPSFPTLQLNNTLQRQGDWQPVCIPGSIFCVRLLAIAASNHTAVLFWKPHQLNQQHYCEATTIIKRHGQQSLASHIRNNIRWNDAFIHRAPSTILFTSLFMQQQYSSMTSGVKLASKCHYFESLLDPCSRL